MTYGEERDRHLCASGVRPARLCGRRPELRHAPRRRIARYDPIHPDIMPLWIDGGEQTRRVPDTNDKRLWVKRGKRTVEEAPTVTEPIAVSIKANQRCDHHRRNDNWAVSGNGNVPHAALHPGRRMPGTELERLAFTDDNRQGNARARLAGGGHPWFQVRLAAKRP